MKALDTYRWFCKCFCNNSYCDDQVISLLLSQYKCPPLFLVIISLLNENEQKRTVALIHYSMQNYSGVTSPLSSLIFFFIFRALPGVSQPVHWLTSFNANAVFDRNRTTNFRSWFIDTFQILSRFALPSISLSNMFPMCFGLYSR